MFMCIVSDMYVYVHTNGSMLPVLCLAKSKTDIVRFSLKSFSIKHNLVEDFHKANKCGGVRTASQVTGNLASP